MSSIPRAPTISSGSVVRPPKLHPQPSSQEVGQEPKGIFQSPWSCCGSAIVPDDRPCHAERKHSYASPSPHLLDGTSLFQKNLRPWIGGQLSSYFPRGSAWILLKGHACQLPTAPPARHFCGLAQVLDGWESCGS